MPHTLSHAHRETFDAIVAHPDPHNLHWRDVRSLLDAWARVVEEPNGSIRATRNGQMVVLHPGQHKDVDSEAELKELRGFLTRSQGAALATNGVGLNLLVVIDHREARVYQTELRGTVPERIVPYDPDGSGRHLHYVQDDSNGQRRPERRSYYDAVAKSLKDADKVLLFGSGTGAASAMEQLRNELNAHHKDIAARIIGAVAVDEHHLTEAQLLAKAREYYARAAPDSVAATSGPAKT